MKKNKRINFLTGTLLTSILILIMGCQSSSELIPITVACCANVENKIYVVGGITKNGKTTNILQEYDPYLDTWTNKTSMPKPRAMSSAVAIGNKISLNKRIVVESINNTSLNVNQKVRLSDKFYFRIFIHVVKFWLANTNLQ